MKTAPTIHHLPALRPRPALLLLSILLLAILVACGGNGEETPPPPTVPFIQLPPGATVQVVCGLSCQERAQCGSRDDGGGDVVLMNRSGPAVSNQDAFVAVNTVATVQDARVETVRENISLTEYQATFLRVLTPDLQDGWIPEWCLAQ